MNNEENKNLEEKNKSNKFKDFIRWFKESWAIPRKRAGLKLLGYLLFFIIFFIIAGIGSRNDYNNIQNNLSTTTTTTTTEDTEAYFYKQKLLLENKHYVNYEITIGEESYKINGSLEDAVLDGYLETNEGIKKIKLENSILYEVGEVENTVLETNINLYFIDIQNIISKIRSSRAYIEKKEDAKTYTYNLSINNISCVFKVYTNENNIYKIEINSDNYSYNLNFDI